MRINRENHRINSNKFSDLEEIEILNNSEDFAEISDEDLIDSTHHQQNKVNQPYHKADPTNREDEENQDLSIEDELEILAEKLGGNRNKIKEENSDEIGNLSKKANNFNQDFSLRIFADQKLQDFADIKIGSVHPHIKNEVEVRIDEARYFLSALKKLIKLM